MTGGQLNANVDQYLQAAAMNTPPPRIVSDPLVTGVTPIEQLLRVLGLAANLSDPQDNAESAEEHAKRDAQVTDAAEKFAAQDEEAAQELNSVAWQADPVAQQPGADQATAMVQQLPQAVSSIAGAVSGALGGALQPLAQIPQQIAQGAHQAMQAGMGFFQQAAAPGEDASLASVPIDDFGSTPGDLSALGGDGGADFGDLGGGGNLGGGGLGGGLMGVTAPTSLLGPPPVPSASTAPSTCGPCSSTSPRPRPTPGMIQSIKRAPAAPGNAWPATWPARSAVRSRAAWPSSTAAPASSAPPDTATISFWSAAATLPSKRSSAP